VPFFDVADPRNIDLMVPVAVRGTVTFCISDYQEFVRMNRLTNLNLSELTAQVKDALIRHIKSIVANIPLQHEIPLVGLESQLGTINDIVKDELVPRIINDFGVNLKALDITDISIITNIAMTFIVCTCNCDCVTIKFIIILQILFCA
jgi:hypothetical protein